MDVFELRNQLIDDYGSYIRSFLNIRDQHIVAHVEQGLNDGLLWPDPLLQLNPNFAPGKWIDELVDEGALHSLCRTIFRLKEPTGASKPLRLHRHQSDAVEAANSGDNYVLTTGTGSGKSLSYIIPIVNDVLRRGSGRGTRAIVIYPMNALANSQYNELEKFLCRGFPAGAPVTFQRYTGQETEEEREKIITNPPDILLTNYVMLELMLTRPREKKIVNAARGHLQFLVLDELHTYRGRQGADVALLVRRLRDLCENPGLQCVGTSATLAGDGTYLEQQRQIAGVATSLFGATVKPERVIGETLRRITPEQHWQEPTFVAALTGRLADPLCQPPTNFPDFVADPLAIWIESTFGLTAEATSGRLRRAQPISISGPTGAAAQLSALTKIEPKQCQAAIEQALLAGYQVKHPETDFPVFAFRLHQFISRGDTVYASLEEPANRYITTQGQQYVPRNRDRVLLPLAFCRECGQEYYTVLRHIDLHSNAVLYLPRDLTDQSSEDDDETGFLYSNPAKPWPLDPNAMVDYLPEDWVEVEGGVRRVKPARRRKLPLAVQVTPSGKEEMSGIFYHFIKAPFSFCLNCGISYSSRQRSDYGKLAVLSSEGRSTATTVLSLSVLRALRQDTTLEPQARKLLSFTDNRQDASLQSGHFNDFVEVGLLRAALYKAVAVAGPTGLTHEVLAHRVFDALKLAVELYALDPTVKFQARKETDRALREVLAYRLYQDLRRGWRVTSPNLEQCGLLQIEYSSLDELCVAQEYWADLHPALADAAPSERERIAKTLLDYLRRELVVRVDWLDSVYQETMQQISRQFLKEPWAIDENEQLVRSVVVHPRAVGHDDRRDSIYLSGRSGFGLYLRRPDTLPRYKGKLSVEEAEKIIRQLFAVLKVAGLVTVVDEAKKPEDTPGYQMPASVFVWRAGDGTQPFHDPIRVPSLPEQGHRTNPFFVDYYRHIAATLQGLEAHEHTAQVPNDERLRREERFRTANLPVLYCSPTMELGVDIAQLNVVNMRNVPPTPANYAQRSGRAGRSGQPALVFTYCTTGSPHDQYFFKRPEAMVAGAVAPPRLDLANEDLVRAHVYAVWLAETGLSLGSSLQELLDLNGERPSLEILPHVREALRSKSARAKAEQRLRRIFLSIADELAHSDWYTDEWLWRTLAQVEDRFTQACIRWRELYCAAMQQREIQNAIIGDASRSQADKNQARRLRAEAESQMELLTQSKNLFQSDFYSYRYFASEGFLPGYNFPRLPLSAYIPGRRQRMGNQDEYLNRPRFLAISEFGPRSMIYHEGSRYIVNKVILPVEERSERGLATGQVKLCPHCGYLHPIQEGITNPDRCEHCNTLLDPPMHSLLRMQNVSTKRRDRINSDEEERIRMGYDLVTGVRFDHEEQRQVRVASVVDATGKELLHLTYGHTATLWRLNLGWRRRRDKEVRGFVLDTERGYWARNELATEDDPDDPMSDSKQRVIPYVEDRRNALLIKPAIPLTLEQMASLQPALKSAIQVLYQVEDSELAAEPLPNPDQRNFILIYESAEGGAGVLRQLLDRPDTVAKIAEEALRLCHFDPATGADLYRAPNSREECEAACYHCLMSYYNQMDHRLLDRALVRDFLRQLQTSTVISSPVAAPREDHLANLKALCDSDLERRWLDFLAESNLRLPDEAQKYCESCQTRTDFFYRDAAVAIFIDGPAHDHANIAAADARIEECLTFDLGLSVLRFRYDDDWLAICRNHPAIFGKLEESH